jgi:predicted Zn finger-like uncharacterized protein
MIIECINCNKKFSINSDLIPSTGRTIQCGSCNHVWFYEKKTDRIKSNIEQKSQQTSPTKSANIDVNQFISNSTPQYNQSLNNEKIKIDKKAKSALTKSNSGSIFSLTKFLSYILVLIISFVGLIIVLDTFKDPLYELYPNLELILFNLFETLKDIELFIKDLIKYD